MRDMIVFRFVLSKLNLNLVFSLRKKKSVIFHLKLHIDGKHIEIQLIKRVQLARISFFFLNLSRFEMWHKGTVIFLFKMEFHVFLSAPSTAKRKFRIGVYLLRYMTTCL